MTVQCTLLQQEETGVDDPRTASALLPKNKPLMPNRAIRTVKDVSRDSLQESPPTSPLYSGGISSGGLSSDQVTDIKLCATVFNDIH